MKRRNGEGGIRFWMGKRLGQTKGAHRIDQPFLFRHFAKVAETCKQYLLRAKCFGQISMQICKCLDLREIKPKSSCVRD